MKWTSMGTVWWCAMGTPSPGRSSPGPAHSRCAPHGWTTAGSTKGPGRRCRFRSSILPPWARKSPKVAEVLPLMYLHGMQLGRLRPRTRGVLRLGRRTVGLGDHAPVHRLAARALTSRPRPLKEVDYVYVYADGIHFNVRLQEARLCVLVIVGVRADGTKELGLDHRRAPRVDRVLGRRAS